MCRRLPAISNSVISDLIDEWIHSERDREILKMSLINNKSYEYIAEHFGMSEKQIGRIVRKGAAEIIIHI